MRGKIQLLFMALAMMSCSKDDSYSSGGIDYGYGRDFSHEKIVLGKRLENPYRTENVTRALQELYPAKASRVEVEPTDYYVRFLPADRSQCQKLESMGLHLTDYPLDYEIAVDGDWYHDPEVPENNVTWQYAVVPVDFKFPEDIEYEVIHECYVVDQSDKTKADGIDWEAVERHAFVITGNEDRLKDPLTKGESEKAIPSGRITIVDEHANGGKPFGVAGVMVACNTFVKFDFAYTDRDGYYRMSKSFSSQMRYRLVFKNEIGFGIGLNLILVPASVSTLGKSDLRIWLFGGIKSSSAVMLHHQAALTNAQLASFLGNYAVLIKYLLPDITIGMEGKDDYRSIYSAVCHELAHASHFSSTGTDYWNDYIWYIVESYIQSGGNAYGDGTGDKAGFCEVGEDWAYYIESKMYKERYGGTYPTFGTSYWFNPLIFRYLEERGIKTSQLFAVLSDAVDSKIALKEALIAAYPSRKSVVELVFSRY